MSSPIWTPAALSSERRNYRGRAWRMVEAQHRVSTLKLVDTLAEQALLETLIDDTKPIVPEPCQRLHYLLATPFRYDAVYPAGSRFRRAGRTPGVFYASEQSETAIAEMAFYRLLFFVESPQTPWPRIAAELTAFAVELASDAAIDLTMTPLVRDRAVWTDRTAYAPCQVLADSIRETGGNLIRYESVRDPNARANLAVLECSVFASSEPVARQTWRLRVSANGVQALCEFPEARLEFDRAAFAADPRIAQLVWER